MDNMSRDDKLVNRSASEIGIELQDMHKMIEVVDQVKEEYFQCQENHPGSCCDSMSLGWGCGIDVRLFLDCATPAYLLKRRGYLVGG